MKRYNALKAKNNLGLDRSRVLQLMQMGLIFHDKNNKGTQISTLTCKKSNRKYKSTSALIRVLRVVGLAT